VEKNLGLKKFLGFLGFTFLIFCTKTKHESILLKTNLQWAKKKN